MKSRNWHIQLNTTLPVIAAMKDALAASPVTLVFDHFGNAKEGLGVGQPGFSDLVSLVKSGRGVSRFRSPPARARTTVISRRSHRC